jgi:uncharacterized protein YdaU (DUF1376 family)
MTWYGLSAGERGLLESMARVYWVDEYLPSDPRLIALACRLDAHDAEELLTAGVLAHFERDSNGHLHHVELRRQMQNIAATREKQSEGGKAGVSRREANKAAKRKPSSDAASRETKVDHQVDHQVNAKVDHMVPERKKELKDRIKSSHVEHKDSVPSEHRQWVDEYDHAEACSPALGHGHA